MIATGYLELHLDRTIPVMIDFSPNMDGDMNIEKVWIGHDEDIVMPKETITERRADLEVICLERLQEYIRIGE